MTDRKELYQGLTHAAWGYLFLIVNIGPVDMLPEFAGFLLFRSASGALSKERRDLTLLRPLCGLLAAWYFGDWLLSWFGLELEGQFLFLDLIAAVTALYFHFQFLTDMAALAEAFQPEGSNLDRHIRRRRTAYLLLTTAVALGNAAAGALTGDMMVRLGGQWQQFFPGLMGLAGVAAAWGIAALMVVHAMFRLRRCFREEMQ